MNPIPPRLEEMAARCPIPSATYRLQFNRDFTFAQATAMADYLRDLGITDAYASPLFQAGPESTHGYDTCSFGQFNGALGSQRDFDAWSARLRQLGLGLILDLVPNHMGADLTNDWWADVLERGPGSPFAEYFDIDWRPPASSLTDKVLLPILEDHYVKVLESGKLRLSFDNGTLAIAYHDRKFPVAPHSYREILAEAAADVESRKTDSALSRELRGAAEPLHRSQRGTELSLPDKRGMREQTADWQRSSPAFAEAMERVCQTYNGQPGKPRTFDKLHALLAAQHYRLAYWRVGLEELNYRRFFDVTQLVALRMELPTVFRACHQLVFELLQSGQVTGLRIDHPDGLWDPKEYFRRLQAGFVLAQPGEAAAKAAHPQWPLYVVAEKILSGDEPLRGDWAVEGTTGYDFLNKVNGLFIDSSNEDAFDKLYRAFTHEAALFADVVYASKKGVLERSFMSELNALVHRLERLARKSRSGQDFTDRQMRDALTEVVAAFPVYRTYLTSDSLEIAPLERFHIERAIADAKTRQPRLESALVEFLQDLLLLRVPADFDDQAKQLQREFISRFQQLTGPIMAKGLEDTAFYNYNRLLSLNEVGGDPGQFGVSLDAFHRHNAAKAEQWPHALLATATHDTKRGEDVRARINVLSEMPAEWESALRRWSRLNSGKKTEWHDHPAPAGNDEYFIYQTLVGAWPFGGKEKDPPAASALVTFRDRVSAYMIKALREAKARTDWTDPDTEYERATTRFVEQILDPDVSSAFLDDFQRFQAKVAWFGQFNSLSQLLLKITSPGVPDFYQGTELWDLSLVDPDNRKPVDFDTRRQILEQLARRSETGSLRPDDTRQLLGESHSGAIKLFVMARALAFRRQHRPLFRDGAYLPIPVLGAKRRHVCAFARRLGKEVSLTVVPRLVLGLLNGVEEVPCGSTIWGDTSLDLSAPGLTGTYVNAITSEETTTIAGSNGPALALSAGLSDFPVALFGFKP